MHSSTWPLQSLNERLAGVDASVPHDLTARGFLEPLRGVDCVYQSYALKYLPSSACEEQRYYAHPDMEFPTSLFYADIKSDIRLDNRFDVRRWNSFHVKVYHKILIWYQNLCYD